IDALSFLFSALFLRGITATEPAPVPRAEREGMKQELVAGLRFLSQDRILSALVVSTLILSFSGQIIGTVIVAFMARDLGFKPGILGMIFAVGGITSLVGAMGAGALQQRWGV